jgi:hypothetical protein
MFTNELGQPKRNSVEEVYQYILADINQANTLWGDDVEEANEAYFTSSFAKGLGARVALDMKDYESVVSFTSDIINTGIYSLSSGISFINMWLNDESEEVIWRVRYMATDDVVAPGYNFYNRNNNEDLPKPDYLPAEWLTNLYNSNDIRDSIYFQITKTDFGWSGVLINKYPTNPMFDQQGTNMPKPMRLAEIYLMRAEAYAFLNQDELAADDMDVLLSHRLDIHSGVSLTGDALKEFIFTERIKELVFEGFYWFDLNRMKKGFERVPQEHTSAFNDLKINADDYRWQWPIPTLEINGNPNIKQNPGY